MYVIYEKSLRIFAAPFIFIYGIVKPWQFESAFAANNTPVNELDGMSLMWAFFGYSLTVPIFIGVVECTGALLLLFERTKLLGALALLPVLTNIVLFDLVYEVLPFATMNGIIYLAIILFVLFDQRQKLSGALAIILSQPEPSETTNRFSISRVLKMVAFLFLNWIIFLLIQGVGRGFL